MVQYYGFSNQVSNCAVESGATGKAVEARLRHVDGSNIRGMFTEGNESQ